MIVSCYSWAPSDSDHSFTCGAISWLAHNPFLSMFWHIQVPCYCCATWCVLGKFYHLYFNWWNVSLGCSFYSWHGDKQVLKSHCGGFRL